jgi:hypothetical protein
MSDTTRFSYQTWGSGNTPDEIEASAEKRARSELGDFNGPVRLSSYAIMNTKDPLRDDLRPERTQERHVQAFSNGHKMWAEVTVMGLRIDEGISWQDQHPDGIAYND